MTIRLFGLMGLGALATAACGQRAEAPIKRRAATSSQALKMPREAFPQPR